MSLQKWVSAALRTPRAIAVMFGVVSLQGNVGEVRAQRADFRSPDSAPAAWRNFSLLVKQRFEEHIAADEPIANRFRAWLTQSQVKPDGAPVSLIVRAWLNADGTVARIAFPALPDSTANGDLQAILMRGSVGQSPPVNMLQPLNLRFSLNLPT